MGKETKPGARHQSLGIRTSLLLYPERIEMPRMLCRDGSFSALVKPAAVMLLAGVGVVGLTRSVPAADAKADKPAAKAADAKPAEKDDAAAADKVTYAKDVAPLLKESCV